MSTTSDLIKDQKDFITIAPNGIQWGFRSHFITEADGTLSWYIPSFDIYYSSTTKEEGDKIAIDATHAFFQFYLKKQGFRKFVSKILSLGYTPSNFQELKSLLDRKNINAKLIGGSKKLPKAFATSDVYEMHGQLQEAV